MTAGLLIALAVVLPLVAFTNIFEPTAPGKNTGGIQPSEMASAREGRQSPTVSDTAPQSDCNTPVGAGEPEYQQAFIDAYRRGGGRSKLGCPETKIRVLAGVIHQNFRTDDGQQAAIHATSTDIAYYIDPAALRCINDIAGPAESTSLAGTVTGEPVSLPDGGLQIELGASAERRFELNGVIRRSGDSRCIWIQPEFWPTYKRLGGPTGELGYPKHAATGCGIGEQRQDFDHGSLIAIAGGTVFTRDQYTKAGHTGCL